MKEQLYPGGDPRYTEQALRKSLNQLSDENYQLSKRLDVARKSLTDAETEATKTEDSLRAEIAHLRDRRMAAEKVARAARLYINHINSPLCIGWDDLIDALHEWQEVGR